MTKLQRDKKTGSWASRKVIPADIRAAYGQANEVKRWPSHLSQAEAKAEWRSWLDKIEGRIELLRKAATAEPLRLSHREIMGLAGQWYQAKVRKHEDNPGDALGWDAALDDMRPDVEPEDGQKIVWKEQPFIVEEIDAMLQQEGLRLTPASRQAVIAEAHELFRSLARLMIQRAEGDYSPDKTAKMLPEWAPPQVAAKGDTVVTLTSLFEGYANDGDAPPAASTVKAWRRRIQSFIDFVGYDDANRIIAEDVVRWRDHLASDPTKSATTINDGYISSLRTILNWGVSRLRIKINPAAGLSFRSRKKVRTRDPGFTDEEAQTILAATLAEPPKKLTEGNVRARRWIPWICAYTGARVGEISQLRKEDIQQYDGVWCFCITPEAGSVKDRSVRYVPIHSHLIDQGWLGFVQSLQDGPIFYDPMLARGGSGENPQSKKAGERLCQWIRQLGVTDERIKPNHAWRHRVKTEGRAAGIPKDALDAIQGHAASNVGGTYGRWKMSNLSEEVEKLPRYQIASDLP